MHPISREDALTLLGAAGWEHYLTYDFACYFKRPVIDDHAVSNTFLTESTEQASVDRHDN